MDIVDQFIISDNSNGLIEDIADKSKNNSLTIFDEVKFNELKSQL
jgi:hypothetical protein